MIANEEKNAFQSCTWKWIHLFTFKFQVITTRFLFGGWEWSTVFREGLLFFQAEGFFWLHLCNSCWIYHSFCNHWKPFHPLLLNLLYWSALNFHSSTVKWKTIQLAKSLKEKKDQWLTVAEQDLTELKWKRVNFSLCHECLILPFGYKSLLLQSKLSNLQQVFSTWVVWPVMVPSLRVFPLKTSGHHKSYLKKKKKEKKALDPIQEVFVSEDSMCNLSLNFSATFPTE